MRASGQRTMSHCLDAEERGRVSFFLRVRIAVGIRVPPLPRRSVAQRAASRRLVVAGLRNAGWSPSARTRSSRLRPHTPARLPAARERFLGVLQSRFNGSARSGELCGHAGGKTTPGRLATAYRRDAGATGVSEAERGPRRAALRLKVAPVRREPLNRRLVTGRGDRWPPSAARRPLERGRPGLAALRTERREISCERTPEDQREPSTLSCRPR